MATIEHSDGSSYPCLNTQELNLVSTCAAHSTACRCRLLCSLETCRQTQRPAHTRVHSLQFVRHSRQTLSHWDDALTWFNRVFNSTPFTSHRRPEQSATLGTMTYSPPSAMAWWCMRHKRRGSSEQTVANAAHHLAPLYPTAQVASELKVFHHALVWEAASLLEASSGHEHGLLKRRRGGLPAM